MNKKAMLKVLEDWFKEHREEAFLTCPENCLCWDIEFAINEIRSF